MKKLVSFLFCALICVAATTIQVQAQCTGCPYIDESYTGAMTPITATTNALNAGWYNVPRSGQVTVILADGCNGSIAATIAGNAGINLPALRHCSLFTVHCSLFIVHCS